MAVSRTASADLRVRLSAAGRGSVVMTVVTLVASFASQILLGRRFGPAGLGEYHATTLYVIMLATLASAGLPLAIAHRVARLEEEERSPELARTISTSLGLAIAAALIVAILGSVWWQPFGALAGLREPAPTWLVVAALVGSVLLSLATGILLGRLQMIGATALVLLQPLTVIVGMVLGPSTNGSLLAALGAALPGLAAFGYLTTLPLSVRIAPAEALAMLRQSLAAATTLYPNFLAGWLERFLIVTLVSPAALGAFAAASALTEGILRLARNVGTFSVPAYARLSAEGSRTERVLGSHIRIMSVFFIVAAVVMVAAGPGFLSSFFGPGFAVAGTTVRLLAITLVPYGLLVSIAGTAIGTDQLRRATRIMLFVAPLHVAAVFLGVRYFSIAGVALADLIVWIVSVVAFAAPWSSRPFIAMPLGMRVAGITVPLAVLAWWLSLEPLAWLASGAIAGAIGALACGLLLVSASERSVLAALTGHWQRPREPSA